LRRRCSAKLVCAGPGREASLVGARTIPNGGVKDTYQTIRGDGQKVVGGNRGIKKKKKKKKKKNKKKKRKQRKK